MTEAMVAAVFSTPTGEASKTRNSSTNCLFEEPDVVAVSLRTCLAVADTAVGARGRGCCGGSPVLPNVNAAATHAATKYLKGDAVLSFAEDTMGNAVLTDGQSD